MEEEMGNEMDTRVIEGSEIPLPNPGGKDPATGSCYRSHTSYYAHKVP